MNYDKNYINDLLENQNKTLIKNYKNKYELC